MYDAEFLMAGTRSTLMPITGREEAMSFLHESSAGCSRRGLPIPPAAISGKGLYRLRWWKCNSEIFFQFGMRNSSNSECGIRNAEWKKTPQFGIRKALFKVSALVTLP